MPNVGEFINAALIKAGVAPDNEFLKKILTNAELTKEAIPDELVSQFNSNLINLDQAKSNFDLKNHFYGSALAPVEKELMNLATAYELSEEDIAEISGIKSTFSKIPALKSKLDAAIQKKAAAAGGDKGKHAEEIVRLNAEIAAAKAEIATATQRISSEYESKFVDMALNNFMAQYSFTDAIPKEVAAMTARNLFDQTVSAKGAKYKLVNNELTLVNANDESLPFMQENQPVQFRAFVDKIVADNKLLKTAAPAAGGNPPNPPASGGGGNNPARVPNATMDYLNKQIKDLESSKVG
jgi:hypothetical protein